MEPEPYEREELGPYYDDVQLHDMQVRCQRCGGPLLADAAEVVDAETGEHLIVDYVCMKWSDEMA